MADENGRLASENAAQTFEPRMDYSKEFSAPGYVETGDWPTPNVNALRQQEAIEGRQQARQDAIRIAQEQEARAQTEWQRDFSFGAVVKPENNTLRAYKRELKQSGSEDSKDIRFSGRKYGVFDAVIIHEVGLDQQNNSLSPAFNPNHPRYNDYAPLRRNLAILRDYLLVNEFPDAVYKPGDIVPDHEEDKKNLLRVQEMALALGKELGGIMRRPRLLGRWAQSFSRIMTGGDMTQANTSAFMEAANVPDAGIATMYESLLNKQGKATVMDAFMSRLTPSSWNLPPIEQTPFSDKNMRLYSLSSTMTNIADALQHITSNIGSIQTMSVEDKVISVEEARKILKNLRIKIGQGHEGERLDITDQKRSDSSALLHAAIAFQDSMAALVKVDPNVLHDPDLIAAARALGHANYQVTMDTARILEKEGKHDAAQAMLARAQQTDEEYKSPMPIKEITDRLEKGLDVAGKLDIKYASKIDELRASRANQINQQVIHNRQDSKILRKVEAAIKPHKMTSSVDDSSFFRGKVAGISHPEVVPAAVKANTDAPYLTITPGRKV